MRFLVLLLIFLSCLSIRSIEAAGKKNLRQDGIPSESSIEHQGEQEVLTRIDLLCSVCADHPVNTLFLPCNHITACQDCAGKLTTCPQCRVEVKDKVGPIFTQFFSRVDESLVDEKFEDFEPLCVVCNTEKIDTVLYPCRHVNSCHECASKMDVCPLCFEEIKKKSPPVFISSLPELRETEQITAQRSEVEINSDYEYKQKLHTFIEAVKDTADLLAEIEVISNKERLARSGGEFVVRAQAAALFSLGLEFSIGTYTTSGFRGVPYIQLGCLSGCGAPSVFASFSLRRYMKSSHHPSSDFSARNADDDSQDMIGFIFGKASHYLRQGDPSEASFSYIHEKGVAIGGFATCGVKGTSILRIPFFIPTRYLSKKGRLFIEARHLERQLIKRVSKKDWNSIYDHLLPRYYHVVQNLRDRLEKKNVLHRTHHALSTDHPFFSVENLVSAIRK
jgi:hypothetical protein